MQNVKRPEGVVVFISGTTGQDGSHLADYLLANTTVSVIGGARRLSVENHINIKHLENEPRFQLVNFDLSDAHSISETIEQLKPDYFINFAAQSFVASSWDFARQTWQTNSTAVLDILESIRKHKPECRFYNAGSSEEFGDVQYIPQDELHPLRPRSPYGASKAAARQIVKVYRESYGLYAIQGWLFNHEGPRRGDEFVTRKITKGVAGIVYNIKNNTQFSPIELGNVYSKRDWSDAEDFVAGVWMMMNQELYRPELTNIHSAGIGSSKRITNAITPKLREYVLSSDETHTIKEFVEKAFRIAGIEGVWHGDGMNEEFSLKSDQVLSLKPVSSVLVKINPNFYRPAEVDFLLGNSSKFRKDFNWSPKTNFDGLIKKMVEFDIKKMSLPE